MSHLALLQYAPRKDALTVAQLSLMLNQQGHGTIWIVDDSTTDADRVAATLRPQYTVRIFHDGPAALEQLMSSPPPDLLLLDWIMPGMSGIEICTYVRSSRSPISQIPIILLTAQHGREEIDEAFKCGANDYIVKPFAHEELRARVRNLTGSKRHLERAQGLVVDLQRSEERLLMATSSAGIGIWEWDIRSGIVASTDIHRRIFELPAAGQLTFKDILEKVLPEDRVTLQQSLTTAIENNSDYSSEFRIQKSDGLISWIYGHGRAVCDEDGKPLRMVGVHADVSSQKKIAEELKRSKEEAERANQMKSAFLANMSHEIRTPLGAMLGFAHLMQDPSVTKMELSNYLEVLTRNGEQLSVIINDILDLSKVEAGLLAYEHHEFDPAEICNDVISLFQSKAKEKGLTLEYISDPSTPAKVITDPTRLRQITMNLVSNSLKFTRTGGIKIRTSGVSDKDGKNYLTVEVEDTGIGIPTEHAERIFDMFFQGDDSMTRRFGGTGIGLALSQQLTRELGGDLKLIRTNSEGSLFQASVRNQSTRSLRTEARPKTKTSSAAVSLTDVRVLVVDDSPDNQNLLFAYLTKYGAQVEIAGNGIEAYQKALSNPYDIILMDLQMPIMDGYTATRKLRKEGYKKPIIALTAHAMSEVSAQCLEVGCNGYLPKPINPNELLKTISAHSNI